MLDGIVRDIRYALRALRGRPGLTFVATLSLALGIGANTAIFSLIDAAMLKSLPVSRPAELLQVTMGPKDYLGYSNPIWEQLRDRQDVFSGIFAYGRWALDLSGGGEVHSLNGYLASGQLFDTLGVHAALGRTFTPADDYRGCPGTTVLSYAFWQREYGGRPDIVGKTISLNSHPFEVLGVSEPRFTGIDTGYSVDVMVPLCTEKILHGELNLLDSTFIPGWLRIVARPRPDVTAAQATARLKTLAPLIYRAAVPQAWPAAEQQRFLARTFDTEPAGNGMPFALARYRQPLFILMAMVGLVLAIACANVANLLLARGAARQREIGIRIALGCGRSRLFRQLLTESLLLSAGWRGARRPIRQLGDAAPHQLSRRVPRPDPRRSRPGVHLRHCRSHGTAVRHRAGLARHTGTAAIGHACRFPRNHRRLEIGHRQNPGGPAGRALPGAAGRRRTAAIDVPAPRFPRPRL